MKIKLSFLSTVLLLFLFSFLISGAVFAQSVQNTRATRRANKNNSRDTSSSNNLDQKIPAKVIVVLKYVLQHHEAPEGFVGSRRFGNYEGRLPGLDSSGNKVSYQEWDVNEHKRWLNRGPERLITGSDHKAWYTPNHYQTFIEIKDVY